MTKKPATITYHARVGEPVCTGGHDRCYLGGPDRSCPCCERKVALITRRTGKGRKK